MHELSSPGQARSSSRNAFLRCWAALRSPWAIALFGLSIVALDHASGPSIHFPILFVGPVVAAAWFQGARVAHVYAIGLPCVHVLLGIAVGTSETAVFETVNTVARVLTLGLLAHFVALASERQRLAEQIRVLQGILPICSFCKKIRNAEGKWEHLEEYIGRHSHAEFSHGLCDPCAREHYGLGD